jgi:hypothetical protein
MCSGCSAERASLPSDGEVVPADDPDPIPGTGIAARYWAELHPLEGRIDLFELYPGNIIYRGRHVEDLSYNYGGSATLGSCTPSGSCLPPAGTVKLFTNQTQVTFKDSAGVCHSNGMIVTCPTSGPCANFLTFCAPIQMVSNYNFGATFGALPDVVIQLSQLNNLANRVLGCQDDGTSSFGLCHATGPNKVDSASSNLTSPITGNPGGANPTFGCSYCYGNKSRATGLNMPGAADAVMSNGLSATKRLLNTDLFALLLMNEQNHGVTITVRYTLPAFDQPGSQITLKNGVNPVACASPGVTQVTVTGGGFGPPNECFTSLNQCPTSGTKAAGFDLTFPLRGALGRAAATGVSWSDTSVSGIMPFTAAAGAAQVAAPTGTGATNDSVATCSATHLRVVVPAGCHAAGSSVAVTVTALDQFNNTVPSYAGTVHFTSSDVGATLPADYTFTNNDSGAHTFSAVFASDGGQSIVATDVGNNAITGNNVVTVTVDSIAALQDSTTDAHWLANVIEELLWRPETQADINTYMPNGMLLTDRQTLADVIMLNSDEYKIIILGGQAGVGNVFNPSHHGWFQRFLGRNPTNLEIAGILTQWDDPMLGYEEEDIEALYLLGTDEYYQLAGGTDVAWVTRLYQDVLFRMPTNNEMDTAIALLVAGDGRAAVAWETTVLTAQNFTILAGGPDANGQLDPTGYGDFPRLVYRSPTPAEINVYATNAGDSNHRQLIACVLAGACGLGTDYAGTVKQFAVVGSAATLNLATFAGDGTNPTASILWGDSTPASAGTVGGGFVSGTHTYTNFSLHYIVSVQVQDACGANLGVLTNLRAQ